MKKELYTISDACKRIGDKHPLYVWRIIHYFRIPYQKINDVVYIHAQSFDYVVDILMRMPLYELDDEQITQDGENINAEKQNVGETQKNSERNGKKTKHR